MRQQLREYSLRIDDFVREQEVLQAKVNIHDEMNRLMLTSVATKAEALDRVYAQWEKNALLLCREADEKSDRQATEQLCLSLGMKLEWQGELPGTLAPKQTSLFFAAAQEAAANAFKHGRASRLVITIRETDEGLCCCFENDGRIPQGEIRFTGGLANLKRLAREADAEVSVRTGETFCLLLRFAGTTYCQKGDRYGI